MQLAFSGCLIRADTTEQTIRDRDTLLCPVHAYTLLILPVRHCLSALYGVAGCAIHLSVSSGLSRHPYCVLFVLPDSVFPLIGPISMEMVHYCERFIEFMIDLEVRELLWWQAVGAVGEAFIINLLLLLRLYDKTHMTSLLWIKLVPTFDLKELVNLNWPSFPE